MLCYPVIHVSYAITLLLRRYVRYLVLFYKLLHLCMWLLCYVITSFKLCHHAITSLPLLSCPVIFSLLSYPVMLFRLCYDIFIKTLCILLLCYLSNSCNMGTGDLPDMYARSHCGPRAEGMYIRQIIPPLLLPPNAVLPGTHYSWVG